jgi:UDP-N-acetylglucosamine 1-carboxyvinyltransferase
MDRSLTIADAPAWILHQLLSITLVVATQANGDVLIHQKTFGKPFVFVDKLN